MITRRQALSLAAAPLASARPKNVLLLMTDEHKPHALGIDGDPLARTPNLDALARTSVRFDNAYCTSPVCVPSRFSLMTGLYPHQGKVWGNLNGWPSEAKTLGDCFSAAGYATANIGKLHAVSEGKHGFHELLEMRDWLDSIGGKARIWKEEMDKSGADGRKGPVHVGRVSELAEEDHFESFVARESIRFLNQHRREPFFLVSSFIKPHDPFMPAARWAKLFPAGEDAAAGDVGQARPRDRAAPHPPTRREIAPHPRAARPRASPHARRLLLRVSRATRTTASAPCSPRCAN